MTLSELQDRLQELNAQAHDLRARAEAERRDLTVEETEQLDAALDAFDRCKSDIDRLSRLQKQTELTRQPLADPARQGEGRRTQPEAPARPADETEFLGRRGERVPAEYARGPKNGGFRTLGEYGRAVARACLEGGTTDPRLEALAVASTYGTEGTSADGGFAVPGDYKLEIMQKVMGEESLLSRCDQITTSGNTFTMPVDDTTPWQTSGGIQAYWDGEAVAATQSKPALRQDTVKLNKLRALVPVTEELLEDASGLDSYLRKKAPEKIGFKVNLAIVQGTGVGQPLGILNAQATVSIAKVASQVADTLVGLNVIKMYSRMYAPCRSRAVWLIHQDVEPELLTLMKAGKLDTGAADTGWGVPLYLPPGGLSAAPFGTLFGRPVIPTQACETLGDKGDIIFADLSQYLALLKSGPNPRVETSMHLWFDQDLMAFKFVLRMGGQPWWPTNVAARDGSNTYSCFVTLDERA